MLASENNKQECDSMPGSLTFVSKNGDNAQPTN